MLLWFNINCCYPLPSYSPLSKAENECNNTKNKAYIKFPKFLNMIKFVALKIDLNNLL